MLLDTERKQEIAFGAGVLGLVILFAFAGEAFLRLREASWVNWKGMRQTIMTEGETDGIARFIPGTAFENVRVNQLGFTSPEIERPKPEDTIRLVFLGDSVVLSVGLPEEDRLANRISTAVQAAVPGCKVDYVTIAGPSYAFSEIVTLLGESEDLIEPDAYVVVTGGVRDILVAMEEAGGPVTGLNDQPGWFERHSLLVENGLRLHRTLANSRLDASNDLSSRMDPEMFSQVYLDMIESFAARIGPAPTVVVENRGRERDDSDDVTLGVTKRVLLSELDGMSIQGLRQLGELQRRTLRQGAEEHGWVYADPFADLPPTEAYFQDPMHPTAAGVAEITPEVAAHVVDQLRAADPAPACLAGSK